MWKNTTGCGITITTITSEEPGLQWHDGRRRDKCAKLDNVGLWCGHELVYYQGSGNPTESDGCQFNRVDVGVQEFCGEMSLTDSDVAIRQDRGEPID
jgi:hypothetical protein